MYVKNEFIIWSYEGGLVRVDKNNTLLKTYTHSSSFLLRRRRGNLFLNNHKKLLPIDCNDTKAVSLRSSQRQWRGWGIIRSPKCKEYT